MLRYFFIIFGLICVISSQAHSQSNTDAKALTDDVIAYRALASHDMRLADIGYRLSKANAHFCPNVTPILGWVLHDIAQYPDAQLARAAFDFDSPISILHVVKDGSASRAGVQAGDGYIGIFYQDGERIIRTSPIADSGKRNDFERMARTTAHIGHALDELARDELSSVPAIMVMRDGDILSLPFEIEQGCASDYILDARDKIDAGANGCHVRITLGLSNFAPDDDEFAAAVAHELAHNILRHRVRLAAAKNGEGALAALGSNSRIRAIEQEADRLSVWLMGNAGYDVGDAAIFHQRLGNRKGRAIFGSITHNKWKNRVNFITEEIAAMGLVAVDGHGKRRPPMIMQWLQN